MDILKVEKTVLLRLTEDDVKTLCYVLGRSTAHDPKEGALYTQLSYIEFE